MEVEVGQWVLYWQVSCLFMMRGMMKIVIATLLIAAGGLCWGSNRQMCLNPTFSKQEVAQYGQKAKGGHLPSMYFYSIALAKGRGVERDPGLSFKMANDAACRGFQPACYLVALRYNAGCGVEKDKGEAERWFLKFVSWAEKNNDRLSPIVLGNLAWCYLTGHGVKQDPTKAVSLFKQASDNGHLLSAANLGWCYMVGRGVAVDRQKAFHYFEDAALKGSDVAQWYLGLAYLDGMGTATNIIKGVEYLQKSVDSKNVDAQYDLGRLYAIGKDVEQDLVRAKGLLQAAADGGNSKAGELLTVVEDMLQLKEQEKVLRQATNALAKTRRSRPLTSESLNDLEKQTLEKEHHERQMFDRLESFMGVKFGQTVDLSKLKKTDVSNCFEFTPGKLFRGFTHCRVRVTLLSHCVVSVEAETAVISHNSDEYDIVKALIEKKYEKEMVTSFAAGYATATLFLYSETNLRTITLTKYNDGKLVLRATDENMISLENQERKESKKRNAEPYDKDIDAL